MILDTEFLINLLRRDPDAFQKGADLAEAGRPQRVPIPALYELQYGVEMFGDADEQRLVENVLRMYPLVSLDARTAREAARLLAAADQREGGVDQAGIDDIDPLIAAVAAAANEPVLTDNVDDFRKLGVEVETY